MRIGIVQQLVVGGNANDSKGSWNNDLFGGGRNVPHKKSVMNEHEI